VVFGQDGSFSFDALVQRYNSDLANDYGNLASRTLTMIQRYFRGEVPYPSPAAARTAADDAIARQAAQVIEETNALFEDYQFSRALESAWSLVAVVNKYIVENEPWAVAERQDEESRARLATILYTAAEALRIVTALLHAVIPEATARIWGQLGLGDIGKFRLTELKWGQLELGTRLGRVEPVFPRADRKPVVAAASAPRAEAKAVGAEKQPAGMGAQAGQPATQSVVAPSSAAPPAAKAGEDGKITIDDFARIELRVGQVKMAEKVKGADKLLRLEVDIGTEVRQIVAGIAESYQPESLIGRKVVIVAN